MAFDVVPPERMALGPHCLAPGSGCQPEPIAQREAKPCPRMHPFVSSPVTGTDERLTDLGLRGLLAQSKALKVGRAAFSSVAKRLGSTLRRRGLRQNPRGARGGLK